MAANLDVCELQRASKEPIRNSQNEFCSCRASSLIALQLLQIHGANGYGYAITGINMLNANAAVMAAPSVTSATHPVEDLVVLGT